MTSWVDTLRLGLVTRSKAHLSLLLPTLVKFGVVSCCYNQGCFARNSCFPPGPPPKKKPLLKFYKILIWLVADSTPWTDGFFWSCSSVGSEPRFNFHYFICLAQVTHCASFINFAFYVSFTELICFHMILSLNCFASCLWHMTVEVI